MLKKIAKKKNFAPALLPLSNFLSFGTPKGKNFLWGTKRKKSSSRGLKKEVFISFGPPVRFALILNQSGSDNFYHWFGRFPLLGTYQFFLNILELGCILWYRTNTSPVFSQGQLQIWTEHSTLIFENLKPVEKSKNHFSII